MLVGVNGVVVSQPYGKASTPKESVDITLKAGIKCFTIPVKAPIWGINPEKITEDEITKIRGLFGSGVMATGLGFCWPSDYLMITDSKAEWERNLNYSNRLCDIASALGIKNIVIGAPGRSVPLNHPYYDGVKLLSKFWKEACLYAESYGVTFCFEHASIMRCNVGNTTRSLIDLFDAVDSPSFQLIAQIHDMAINDLDIPSAIKAMRGKVKQVHIADVSSLNPYTEPSTSTVLPGSGKLDFVEIFKALKDVGYDGEICIETMLGDDLAAELSESRKHIESKWREA